MLHAAFRNQSALERLELDGNYLSGSLPRALCSLSNLTRLSLGYNQLTGEFMWHIGGSFNHQSQLSPAHNKVTDFSVLMLSVP